MIRTVALLSACLLWALPAGADDQNIPGVGKIGPVVKAHTGFQFVEGPATDARGNVYFTDVRANRIHMIDLTGQLTTFLENSEGCNGLMVDTKGRIIACQGGLGRIIAIDASTKDIVPIAEKYMGKRFNRPNDIVIDNMGGIYFTDPMFQAGQTPQDAQGVYYISPNGEVTRILEGGRPNGIHISPDNKTLYVLYSSEKTLHAYPIEQPGKIGDGKHWNVVAQPGDGMTIDTRGNLYITQPRMNMIQVLSPEGKELGQIKIPEGPANVCFGGKDCRTLFVTARTSVYTIQTEAQGYCVARSEK